jgi:hypothetical protein
VLLDNRQVSFAFCTYQQGSPDYEELYPAIDHPPMQASQSLQTLLKAY